MPSRIYEQQRHEMCIWYISHGNWGSGSIGLLDVRAGLFVPCWLHNANCV